MFHLVSNVSCLYIFPSLPENGKECGKISLTIFSPPLIFSAILSEGYAHYASINSNSNIYVSQHVTENHKDNGGTNY